MKSLKKLFIGTFLFMVLIGGYTNASWYSAYVLPPRQGNNYTNTHNKTTNANYITNKVTAMSNTDRVTFWACNNQRTQISPDYYQGEGSTATIYFNNSYARKGTQIIMGMENSYWYKWERAFVSGDVDFK